MDSILPLLTDPTAWAALATLIAMEVVLGIDNLIFISILTNKLPAENRESARRIGIGLALVMRLALLGTVAWIVQLTTPVFEAFGHGFSWKDMILIAGGLFLVWKATKEIHHNVDPADHGTAGRAEAPGLDGGVGTNVRQAILLQHEVRRSVVENLLSAVIDRFPPHALAVWIDEPHVFGIRPLDGRSALLRVPLGKDVPIHLKQLGCIWHGVIPSSVCTPTGASLT